ncbi:MAG: hypothetical protein ACR2O6_06175, partial [Ilumatobacteraceae bacterium]
SRQGRYFMKKIIVSITAGLALAIGGAGFAAAQGDPEVSLDKGEVEPDGEVTVNIANAEANVPYTVELGEGSGGGDTDGDGAGSTTVNVGAVELGQLDGIVNINGVDFPISVVIAAAAGEGEGGEGEGGEGEEGGDGTPAPTAVNTGDQLSSSNSTTLYAAAAGLFLLGGGALVLRRQSVTRR